MGTQEMGCIFSKQKPKEITNEITKEITNEIINTIKTVITPTGDYESDKARGEAYAKAVGMDEANTKMMEVMATQGPQAAAKAMMDDCGNDYFAMRMRYG